MKKSSVFIIATLSILLVVSGLIIAFLLGRESKSSFATNNEEVKEKSTITDNTVTNKAIEYSEKDTLVINEIEKIEAATDDILKEENNEKVKSKLKGVFISLVDFLFYDGEIKGVSFDELTNAGKEKTLQIINSIDEKIEKKYPEYKDSISSTAKEAFDKASDLIKKGASNIKDFSQKKLGEDNYNRILESKDELVKYTKDAYSIIKDISGDFFGNAKDKVKNWYEKFKDE